MATRSTCVQFLNKYFWCISVIIALAGFFFGFLCGRFVYFKTPSTNTDDHATDVVDLSGKEVFNSSIEAGFIDSEKIHNESCRIQCKAEDLHSDVIGVEYHPPTGVYCKCPEISGCCVDPGHILKPTGNVTEYRVYKETGRNKTTRFVKMPFTNPSRCECRPRDD